MSKLQEAQLSKLQSVGNSELGVAVDDEVCAYLIGRIIHDLKLRHKFPNVPRTVPDFFGAQSPGSLRIKGLEFRPLFERLLSITQDADSYFFCLGSLHKARLKYERILQAQPIPTVDQVGPRGLLQFGALSPRSLIAFLFWRKWFFDIDNRAGQETGYLFEPIIAHAIGGIPAPAQKSPIKRKGGTSGRQVDCVRSIDKRAYEIRLRVTIAASGQGRWSEEMQFPEDARSSGYTPVLVVLDPTQNPKLTELSKEFKAQKGEVYVGGDAWAHLEEKAGPTMAKFLEKYVRAPLQSLLKEAPEQLPDLLLQAAESTIIIAIGDEKLTIHRNPKKQLASGLDQLPADADSDIPVP